MNVCVHYSLLKVEIDRMGVRAHQHAQLQGLSICFQLLPAAHVTTVSAHEYYSYAI
jgi:hypothetical protein